MTEHEEKKAEEMFQSFQKNYTQEDVEKINSKINGYNYCGSSLRGFAYRCHSRYYPGIGADR